MEKVFEYLSNNWDVVIEAPLAFILFIIISLGITYTINRWRFSVLLEHCNSKADILKERLDAKTEKLEKYDGISIEEENKIIELMTVEKEDLANRTLNYVERLRTFIEKNKLLDQDLQHLYMSNIRTPNSKVEKDKIWNEMTNKSSELSTKLNLEYNRSYKIEAILLRDELRNRLDQNLESEKRDDMIYQHPTNYFGYEEIAEKLELMAKSL